MRKFLLLASLICCFQIANGMGQQKPKELILPVIQSVANWRLHKQSIDNACKAVKRQRPSTKIHARVKIDREVYIVCGSRKSICGTVRLLAALPPKELKFIKKPRFSTSLK